MPQGKHGGVWFKKRSAQAEVRSEAERKIAYDVETVGVGKLLLIGKPFKPAARQTKILTEATLVGESMAKANSAERRFADVIVVRYTQRHTFGS